jgi:hypothetical protein
VDTARWESLGFFAMRTPLLPFDELESLADSGVEAVDARIVELFRRPRVREALFLASPSLEERLSLLLAGGEETDLGKLQRSLSRVPDPHGRPANTLRVVRRLLDRAGGRAHGADCERRVTTPHPARHGLPGRSHSLS